MARRVKTKPINNQVHDKIISVAAMHFSEYTYAGARIEKIVEDCDISKSLLYYYFKSKEELFEKVIDKAYNHMRISQNKWLENDADPVKAIETLSRNMFRFFMENRWIINIWHDENLQKARHIQGKSYFQKHFSPLLLRLTEILDLGKKKNEIKEDIDAFNIYITISSLSYYYHSNMYTLSVSFDKELGSKKQMDAWENYIAKLVVDIISLRK